MTGVTELLRPVDVLGHQLDLARIVEQTDDRFVPVGIRLQTGILRPLVQKTLGLHDLQRQCRCLKNQGEDRVWI